MSTSIWKPCGKTWRDKMRTCAYICRHAWCLLNGWRLRKVKFLPMSRHSLRNMSSSSLSFSVSAVRSTSDLTGSDALYGHRYKYAHAGTERRWLSFYYPFSSPSSYKFSSLFFTLSVVISSRLRWFFNDTTSS